MIIQKKNNYRLIYDDFDDFLFEKSYKIQSIKRWFIFRYWSTIGSFYNSDEAKNFFKKISE